MPKLTDETRFRLRLAELALQLDERIRLAEETRRMVERDAGQFRRSRWFVIVAGVGHGCRPGQHEMDGPPPELEGEQLSSASAYRR